MYISILLNLINKSQRYSDEIRTVGNRKKTNYSIRLIRNGQLLSLNAGNLIPS